MKNVVETERIHTVVVGGGQAGLSVGYHLKRQNVPFVILDASPRIGEVWRKRWDSLRVFSPAKLSGLDGLRFPAPRNSFPTKDQMADYLQTYARTFQLPVLSGTRVERVSRHGERFLVVAGDRRFEADNVIVAMGNYQRPRTPPFAHELNPKIVQIHSFDYRRPSQLVDGPVLVVGAGNSGAEIALEAAETGHQTWLAGPDVGHVPFDIDGLASRLIMARVVLRVVFHRILSVANPIGRKVRPKMLHGAGPLVRTKPWQLVAAGVHRTPRVVGVRDGRPVLEDGQVLDVATVVWCTGFHPGFSWIDLPIFGPDGEPLHDRGIVKSQPGLYFVGLHFLYALSSEMIHGVGRDARRVADFVAARKRPAERSHAGPVAVPIGGVTARESTMQRLALGGVAGPVLFAFAASVAASLQPGYSHLTSVISELGASGAPYETFMNYAGFVPAGLLLAMFGVALAAILPRHRLALVASGLVSLFGCGVAAAGIFSCDIGCPQSGGSVENAIHRAIGPIAFPCLIAAAAMLGIYFRRLPAWRRLGTYSLLSSAAGLLFMIALLNSLEARTLAGVWQRLMIGVLFVWTSIVGLAAHRSAVSQPWRWSDEAAPRTSEYATIAASALTER